MRITLHLMGLEFITVDLSIPRINLFSPGVLPSSVEAIETWAEDD